MVIIPVGSSAGVSGGGLAAIRAFTLDRQGSLDAGAIAISPLLDVDAAIRDAADSAACPIARSIELSWSDEIVIDATNAVLLPSLEPVPLGGLTSSEIVAQLVPGADVVKAANTFSAEVLSADPLEAGGRRVMLLCGDNAEAKRAVGQLFDTAGFFPIDLGDLVTGSGMQQAGGPLAGHNLVRMAAPWE